MKLKRIRKNNNKTTHIKWIATIKRITGIVLPGIVFLVLMTMYSMGFSQENGIDSDKQAQVPKQSVTVEYSDVDIIQNPVVGFIVLPKDRWKNWTARGIYLVVINSLIFVVILSLPKTEKYNILASYFLSGASFMISFWLMMLSYLLFRLKAEAGSLMFLVSLISLVVSYIVLVKVKNCDVIDEIQKPVTTEVEDKRFSTISGHASELPEDDFVK